MSTPEPGRGRALVFDDPDVALDAVKSLRGKGYDVRDVYTPFPVHGMSEALGLGESRISRATLIGGATGLTAALALQIWTHVVDWPLNVGGKTNLALPAIVPVSFELTILFAGLATFVALLVLGKLRPRASMPATQPHPGVTDDRFVVVVNEPDDAGRQARLRTLCAALAPVEERAL